MYWTFYWTHTMYITNSATCKVRRWFGIKQSSERSRRGFTAAWARYNSLGEDCRDFITGQILLWSSDTTSMLINWNLFTLCYYSSHCLLMWIFFDQILGLYGLFLVVFLLYHRMDGEHSMALHLFFCNCYIQTSLDQAHCHYKEILFCSFLFIIFVPLFPQC